MTRRHWIREALYQPYSDREFLYQSEDQENVFGPYVLPPETYYEYEPDDYGNRTLSLSYTNPRKWVDSSEGLVEEESNERNVNTTRKEMNLPPVLATSDYGWLRELISEVDHLCKYGW